MSVQNSYSDSMAVRSAGKVEKQLVAKTFNAHDSIKFGRFVRFQPDRNILKAGADKISTSTNITTGTITMTLTKKNLSTGENASHNISVAFDTDNNTTYANLKTAIEGLSNVTVDLIDSGGSKRGIVIKPASGYEFTINAMSFPVTALADLSQTLLGMSEIAQLETDEYKKGDSVSVLISGSAYVNTLENIATTDKLYLKVVGTESEIGSLTKTKDGTSIELPNLKILGERSDGAVHVSF